MIRPDNHGHLSLIAGPCLAESRMLCEEVAGHMAELAKRYTIPYLFKASFDKANRTSHASPRGPGMDAGLAILEHVRHEFDIPILTDVHEATPLHEVAAVVDVLQTPALLCRQTDFMQRVAGCGLPVNVKKGQFLSPTEMVHVVRKMRAAGAVDVWACERGSSFGYQNLVVDMRGLEIMKRDTGCPVILDCTHSVQLPGAGDGVSAGQSWLAPVLARAGVSVGIAGVFMEVHPRPSEALSDGPNSIPLHLVEPVLERLVAIDRAVKPWLTDG